jgi:hypothetical protein
MNFSWCSLAGCKAFKGPPVWISYAEPALAVKVFRDARQLFGGSYAATGESHHIQGKPPSDKFLHLPRMSLVSSL